MQELILDILIIACLVFGLAFFLIGAIGLVRLPDLYNRMHAATKGVTLGILGVMIALTLIIARQEGVNVTTVVTKGILIIMFQFIAAPVAAHMLSKAAHLDPDVKKWDGTLEDDLLEDREKKEAA
jgi:multicomponent Na+:H+ antiporter subunit G